MKKALGLKRTAAFSAAMATAAFALYVACAANGEAISSRSETEFTFHHPSVVVRYHRATGTMDVEWADGNKLLGLSSSAVLDDGREEIQLALGQLENLQAAPPLPEPAQADYRILKSETEEAHA